MSQAYPADKSGQPGSTPLPSRSATVKTTTTADYDSDEEAVPEYDTNDTVGTLTERLQAWKHACGYLENYLHAAEKMEKAQSKEYEKMLKAISSPLKEGHHFDQEIGGIAGLFDNLRSNTQGVSNSHTEAAKNLNGTVLPILTRLHGEIKSKNKEITSGAGKVAKAVASARNSSQRHIELLGQHAASFDSAGGKIDAQHDPYVLHRGAQYRLHKQVIEENNSRNDFIAVQKNFEIFEAHIVQVFQQAFVAFHQVMESELDRQKAMYGDVVATAQRITPDFEWTRYVGRNGHVLVDQNSPLKEVKNIRYPNEEHASTKPLIQGTLERRSRMTGALTGFKSGFYAVTPSKYLHQFETDDNFRKEPSPELSLYLPDCVLGAVVDTKFNIKGKDLSKGKVGTKLQLSREISFKAPTASDAEEWHRILSSCTSGVTSSPPKSPTGSAASIDESQGPSDSPAANAETARSPTLVDAETVQSPTSLHDEKPKSEPSLPA